MRAKGWNERPPVAPGNEAQLQMRGGARRYRIDRPVGIAGAKREHLERVPAEHPLGGGQSRFAPIGIDRRSIRLAGLDVRERAPDRLRNGRRAAGRPPGCARARRPSRRSRWRARYRDSPGARPSCPNDAPRRADDAEIEIERAAGAQEDRRPVRAKARAVGGDQHVRAQRRRARFAGPSQPGRTDFLAHFHQQLGVEAESPARSEHLPERGEVDRVLTLVVGRAPPVPAASVRRNLPWRAARGPLAVVPRDDVAVAVDQHRRQRRILDPLGEEHRRRARDRIVPLLAAKAEPRNAGPISSVR